MNISPLTRTGKSHSFNDNLIRKRADQKSMKCTKKPWTLMERLRNLKTVKLTETNGNLFTKNKSFNLLLFIGQALSVA